jgi:hypothetical protein
MRIECRPGSQSTVVIGVDAGGQAEKAGILIGDVICFAGSNGTEEIPFDLMKQAANSSRRPISFELRRLCSEERSLLIARFCLSHQQLDAQTFAQLTKNSFLPKIHFEAAQDLLEVEAKFLAQDDGSSVTSELTDLQDRCIRALSNEWGSIDLSNRRSLDVFLKQRPVVLAKLLERSLSQAKEDLAVVAFDVALDMEGNGKWGCFLGNK